MEPNEGRADQAVPAVAAANTSMALDRRARRRQQTIDEILDIAIQVMAEEGVAGLSLSEVARRMGIQPPSLYKYFPSKLALYDTLFQRGARELLAVYRAAAAQAEPGWAALLAGTEAIMRLGLDHQVVAQLLNWRPVPGFEPSPEASPPASSSSRRRAGCSRSPSTAASCTPTLPPKRVRRCCRSWSPG